MNSYENIFDRALRTCPVALSHDGIARRAEIAVTLASAVVSRRRRRQALQLTALLVLAAAILVVSLPRSSPQTHEDLLAPPAYENLSFELLRDDPGILTRCAAKPSVVPKAIWIDDAGLIDLLRAAQRPSGLLRVGGRLILTNPIAPEEPPD